MNVHEPNGTRVVLEQDKFVSACAGLQVGWDGGGIWGRKEDWALEVPCIEYI